MNRRHLRRRERLGPEGSRVTQAVTIAGRCVVPLLCWCVVGCKPAATLDARPAPRARPRDAVDVSTLPKLAPPLPPLDGGRVEVSIPDGWHLLPRDGKSLVRCQLSQQSAYPIIFVEAAASPDRTRLAVGDLPELAAGLQQSLDEELSAEGFKLAEDVVPVAFDGFAGVEYIRTAQSKGTQLERLFLVTVAGGRQYTVELRAILGTTEQFRPYALSVAHGLKFVSGPSKD
jgi:hypothetical protein